MSDKAKTPKSAWRHAAVIGLAVGLALPLSQGVAANTERVVGPWPAFALGLLAAAIAGALAGLALGLLALRTRKAA